MQKFIKKIIDNMNVLISTNTPIIITYNCPCRAILDIFPSIGKYFNFRRKCFTHKM